jgi:hypothetical protein
VFAQNAALVSFGGGVMNTRAVIHYQVSQGELRQLRVRIPADQRLLKVEGEFIRTWELRDDVLTVELVKGISPACQLRVETERVSEPSTARLTIETPRALDVKRETGVVALRAGEELALTVEQVEQLQRVDAEEFARAMPDEKGGVASAFRYLSPDYRLAARVEAVQPVLETLVRQRVRLGPELAQVVAQVDYTIKRAGVFSLAVALPAEYRLESVSGAQVAQWVERTEEGRRVLEIALKERVIGNYVLTLGLARNYREAPARFSVPALYPLNVAKLSGFVTVITEPGLAAKTEVLQGLTEIPFGTAQSPSASEAVSPRTTSSALAYKFLTATPGVASPWQLEVTTEAVEPWVRAEIMVTETFAETFVAGRALVKYDIVNAPVKEFRLKIPSAFRNVDITGEQIRRRDQDGENWRVELQGKVRGDYYLTVTWEMPRSAGTNAQGTAIELEPMQALGVERETGYLCLVAKPPLQVSEQAASELLARIDTRELPSWGGPVDAAAVLAYRYVRPGYRLVVDARRFEEAAVLQALIETARLTTVVADDGQVMTEISLSIRNQGRQHLEVQLPEGSTVWSAFVAGDPVRPNRREGKLLLPLTRETASDAAIQVELTCVGSRTFPRRQGRVWLESPTFDIPMKNARWDVYLPPDYEYSDFGGSMARSSDAVAPMVQVYSLSEYNLQQQAQVEQKREELDAGLKDARQSLTGGNLRGAVNFLSRAKAKGQSEKLIAGKEFKEVEADLRKAQSSNLISAQNNYFFENAARLGDAVNAPALNLAGGAAGGGGFGGFIDPDVAGLQWDKLEKAQQVAVAKVAPLRVNLPTRGVHYSFTQVLQTETGKPMTVGLKAENTKSASWLGRMAWTLGGFLALWLIMGFINSQRETRLEQAQA